MTMNLPVHYSLRKRLRQPLPAGATQRGRGMVVADLNLDDDSDCRDQQLPPAPRRYRLCCGAGLQVGLRWARSPTSFAIGSGLVLSTDAATYWRAIRVGSGHVPSDSSRVHFGLPRDQRARSLRVGGRSPCRANSAYALARIAQRVARAAADSGMSLNRWIRPALERRVVG